MLAPVTPDAVEAIQRHADTVIEVGAGDGAWASALRAAGLRVRAYDIQPDGAGVARGDHIDAADEEGALLMVWPPDGYTARTWLQARERDTVVIVGDLNRMFFGDDLEAFDLVEVVGIPPGRKGASQLHVFRRKERQQCVT